MVTRLGGVFIKNRSNILVFLGVLFFFSMSISGIYALVTQSTEASLSTGVVGIKINIYRLNEDNEEVAYGETSTSVMPGEKVSFIPKIHNYGEDCYVRVNFSFIEDGIAPDEYVDNFLSGVEKHGDYYYYQTALHSNEEIKLFDSVNIPSDIKDGMESFQLIIAAEAIQEKNFTPDYTLEDPWKGITPKEKIVNQYEIEDGRELNHINITFLNDTDKEIKVPSDFLSDMKNMMPGDEYTGTIDFSKKGNNKANYYLTIESDLDDTKQVLLRKLKLTISDKSGHIIYEGNFNMNEEILIGEYGAKDKDSIDIKINIPEELENEITMLNLKANFVFSSKVTSKEREESSGTISKPVVEPEIEEKSGDIEKEKSGDAEQESPSQNESGDENPQENPPETVSEELLNPKTGDNIKVAMAIFFLSSFGLIVVMILSYLEKRKKEY